MIGMINDIHKVLMVIISLLEKIQRIQTLIRRKLLKIPRRKPRRTQSDGLDEVRLELRQSQLVSDPLHLGYKLVTLLNPLSNVNRWYLTKERFPPKLKVPTFLQGIDFSQNLCFYRFFTCGCRPHVRI